MGVVGNKRRIDLDCACIKIKKDMFSLFELPLYCFHGLYEEKNIYTSTYSTIDCLNMHNIIFLYKLL